MHLVKCLGVILKHQEERPHHWDVLIGILLNCKLCVVFQSGVNLCQSSKLFHCIRISVKLVVCSWLISLNIF